MRQATKRSEARIWQKKNVATMTRTELLAEIGRVERMFKTGPAYDAQQQYLGRLRAQFEQASADAA